ncbi:hypothetical protein FDP41_007974 [Naegleria fowleri]|uniref:Uncharacterized protein n=1 Tax=Naegleria fowleri TaxID=5763 RepID=A0A6A5CFJ2_NAEFO|nr:uncharacterized protein FDP41_007974 [Naegleria fowleri]KAF0984059.1 hypothetical protein FDP41_007974 [Naegleria fowleri]CAG4707669.1 unnamed protein product [Naegleria fowleri]
MCFGGGDKAPAKPTSNGTGTTPQTQNTPAAKPPKKILLVGAGDSGKSTIFKQMRLIYNNGFTTEEKTKIKPMIYENILRNMMVLIQATKSLNLPISTEENRQRAEKIEGLEQKILLTTDKVWDSNLAQDIAELWKEPAILQAMARRNEFQIEDSASYYFDNLDRIGKDDYMPSEEDVVRARIKTTGLIEQPFTFKNLPFCMIDVGGQRTERKKWIHHFQGVDSILFVCSLSEFDQKCYEDDSTNRMKESLSLFGDYINSKWFADTLVYLLFNKHDLFVSKIKNGSRLADTFEEYKGPENDPDAAKEFIKDMYKEKDTENRLRDVFFVTALDKANLKERLEQITSDILSAENDL